MNHIPARRQRGAAAIVTSVMLLLITSVVMFYLNRSLIFEQKTSANQLRSTSAQEAAEAGLEWSIGMLNLSSNIGTNCNTGTGAGTLNFRKMYVQTYWNRATMPASGDPFYSFYEDSTVTVPVRKTFPGCKMNGDATLSCNCPAVDPTTLTVDAAGIPSDAGGVAALGTTALPAFTITLAPVGAAYPPAAKPNLSDPMAVLVTVTGCTATAGNCGPGTTAGGAGPDSVATVSAIVKLRPLMRAGPAAALTCGGSCSPGGSNQIINTDPGTNGVTINAGGNVNVSGGATTTTMPGLPPQNAQISGDASLSSLASTDTTCANSSIFKAYFGSTLADYQKAATSIDCTSATDCGPKIMAAYNDNKRSFYFPSGLTLNNSSGLPGGMLGSPTDGVTLVTPAAVKINGNISIYGVLFSNDAVTSELGMGTSNIYGSVVTCRDQSSNGNGTIAYDPKVIRSIQRGDTAEAVRVPGSWTDSCKLSSASPPVRTCN